MHFAICKEYALATLSSNAGRRIGGTYIELVSFRLGAISGEKGRLPMTPMVLTVAQQKGGAGKTTIAAHLAAYWADKGYPIGLIDVDRQGSLTRWYQRRQSALREGVGGMHLSAASGWSIRSEVQRLGRDHKIVIIDTPPHGDSESRFALRVASLVIVPVQ